MALVVFARVVFIQYSEGESLRAEAEREVLREIEIQAERGNIYSSDGKLLATNMPVYDIYMDPVTVNAETFIANIAALSAGLSEIVGGRSARDWENYLRLKRRQGSRYVPIAKDISFSDLQKLRNLPIYDLGKYKGGLIYEQQNLRKMPLGKIAERTIGYDQNRGQIGIEGAFSNYLSGKNGKRLKQKVSNGNWKPVTDNYEIVPEDGFDVITTIDTRMQDVAHHELLAALERFEADHGCVVLMEVKTGAIKAIANLGRTSQGTYFEKRNYAVWERTEPGSTFKLASVMIAMDDGVADTNTIVHTGEGIRQIYDKYIKDSNYGYGKGGYGDITLKHAFEVSSNVGIAGLIQDEYERKPDQFVDRLYTIGLDQPLGISIKGESKPLIPKPGDRLWSGISLPWMSYGYQVSFTPLQILNLYNAVANDGVMVKPHLLHQIRKHGRVVDQVEPEVLNPSICSKETLAKLHDMLEGVVQRGTATNIKNPLVSLAGKTGTCQLNYWKGTHTDYQASFAGYFPAENPVYSCIVVINKPNVHHGYYGSTVAAPVFANIAKQVYVDTPMPLEHNPNAFSIGNTYLATNKIDKLENQTLPNLKGMSGAEAISILENHGYKVQITGNGKVQRQFPPAGSRITKHNLIELRLG